MVLRAINLQGEVGNLKQIVNCFKIIKRII